MVEKTGGEVVEGRVVPGGGGEVGIQSRDNDAVLGRSEGR